MGHCYVAEQLPEGCITCAAGLTKIHTADGRSPGTMLDCQRLFCSII
jgi:hypothetical protein